RAFHVTGVQTCALPISQRIATLYCGAINMATLFFVSVSAKAAELGVPIPGNGGTSEASYGEYIESAYGFAMKLGIGLTTLMIIRSEERRVGKECRSRCE